MRLVRTFGALGGLGFVLACGGVGGSTGSDAAQKLCEHLAKEKEHPCISHAPGSTVTIDDIEVTVDAVRTQKGLATLPQIKNMDERSEMKKAGENALVLEVSFTNTKPVKGDIDFGLYLYTGDGERAFIQPYNSKVVSEGKDGWMDLWDDDMLGPGKTRHAALAYAVPASAVEGTKLVLQRQEKRPDPKDPRGRMKTFVEELYVVDLGPPT